jgi:hypothetical protein
MKRSLSISILCLSAMLTACASKQTPAWLERWLVSPVCEPPCWEGITPGVTTMEEGKSILEAIPDFQPNDEDEYTITFMAKGDVRIMLKRKRKEQATVQYIDLGTDSLPLERIVARYGFPTFGYPEIPIDTPDPNCLILSYPDYGMALWVVAPDGYFDGIYNIQPDTEIVAISFIAPEAEGFGSACSYWGIERIPFTGYGEYELYLPWRK